MSFEDKGIRLPNISNFRWYYKPPRPAGFEERFHLTAFRCECKSGCVQLQWRLIGNVREIADEVVNVLNELTKLGGAGVLSTVSMCQFWDP